VSSNVLSVGVVVKIRPPPGARHASSGINVEKLSESLF